jgi:hypothetical protein
MLSFFLVPVGCYHLCYHLMLSFIASISPPFSFSWKRDTLKNLKLNSRLQLPLDKNDEFKLYINSNSVCNYSPPHSPIVQCTPWWTTFILRLIYIRPSHVKVFYPFSHIKVGGKTEFILIHQMQFLTAMSKCMYFSHNFTDSQHVSSLFCMSLEFLTKLFAPNANFS